MSISENDLPYSLHSEHLEGGAVIDLMGNSLLLADIESGAKVIMEAYGRPQVHFKIPGETDEEYWERYDRMLSAMVRYMEV